MGDNRILRIFENVPDDIEAIVLMNDVDPNLDASFFYAGGMDSGLFEGCIEILWPDGRLDLFASILEETSARSSKAKVRVFAKGTEKDEMLIKALKGVKRIGINGAGLTCRSLDELKKGVKAEFVDVWKSIEKTRIVKDADEIERLREACRIASVVGDEIPSFLKVGMAEFEAAAEVGYRMQKLGASSPAFPTDASFGANAAEPHHSPGSDRLKKGQTALFDFGALYRRYGSDVTRTYFMGSASKRQKEMYEIVRSAQQAGIDAIRAGVNGKDVDTAARKIIDASFFKGLFIHSLGHGIGLSVHDGGRMAQGMDLILKENMVLTVEPGVYVRGEGGVRIEDDIRVTRQGCELLTSASRELRVV
jgi:Xaa-Pro dipeptidase